MVVGYENCVRCYLYVCKYIGIYLGSDGTDSCAQIQHSTVTQHSGLILELT